MGGGRLGGIDGHRPRPRPRPRSDRARKVHFGAYQRETKCQTVLWGARTYNLPTATHTLSEQVTHAHIPTHTGLHTHRRSSARPICPRGNRYCRCRANLWQCKCRRRTATCRTGKLRVCRMSKSEKERGRERGRGEQKKKSKEERERERVGRLGVCCLTHTAPLLVRSIVRTIGASIAAMNYRYAAEIATGELALGASVAQPWHDC